MTNKRGFLAVITLTLFLMIFLPSVVAAEGPMNSVLEIIKNMFGFIPEKLTPSSITSSQEGEFYARFLLWIFVFTVLYFTTTRIPGLSESGRGVVITIPLVLSIISVVLIPKQLILTIYLSYSIVGAMFLMALPLFGLWYLNHNIFTGGENQRWHYFARILVYVIFIALFSQLLKSMEEWPEAEILTASVYWQWLWLVFAIVGIMIVFSVMQLMGRRSTGQGFFSTGEMTPERYNQFEKGVQNEQGTAFNEAQLGGKYIERSEQDQATIDQLQNQIKQFEQDRDAALQKIVDLENNMDQANKNQELNEQRYQQALATNNAEVANAAKAYEQKIANYKEQATNLSAEQAKIAKEKEDALALAQQRQKELFKEKRLVGKRERNLENLQRRQEQSKLKDIEQAINKAIKIKNEAAVAQLERQKKIIIQELEAEQKQKQAAKKDIWFSGKGKRVVKREINLTLDDRKNFDELLRLIGRNINISQQLKNLRNPYHKENTKDFSENNAKIKYLIRQIYQRKMKENIQEQTLQRLNETMKGFEGMEKGYNQRARMLYGSLFSKAKGK